MRIAIFGGTFDPIHNAHLEVARRAAEQFDLDRVLVVPAAHPPHKSRATHAPYEDRVRMAELACHDDPRLSVSRLEENTEHSYSIDTIEKLRRAAPGDEIFFIIGADAFAEIRTWWRWQDVIREVCFIVVSRPGHDYSVPDNARVVRLSTVDLPISSSEIRRLLSAGERPRDLPDCVLQYILQHHLYGS